MLLTPQPRRAFLSNAARGTAALAASSYMRVMGANERVNVGLIGAGERGRFVMSQFVKTGQVDLHAVCDVYAVMIDRARQQDSAPNAAGFGDHRKLLELKELDAVLIATPDHWHAAVAIDAMNAGKDVYIEKPLTLRIDEGPGIIKAARVNNRVCQVGLQQRSGAHYLEAKAKYFDTNALGTITYIRTLWHGNGYHLRKAPASLATLPSNLDWPRFLGQVKWRDWDPQQFWNWRAYLDFGGGQVTDLFTHWIDVVHMFLGHDVPTSGVAAGGVYNYKDGRTAPDTINVLLEYGGLYTASFEATLAPGARGYGIEFLGTKGSLFIDRQHYEYRDAARPMAPVVVQGPQYDFTLDHVKNFLACLKTRQRPNCDVLTGARSAQASHLGNISYVEKRRIDFDPIREEILPL
jgi:predicted dehydrogenase